MASKRQSPAVEVPLLKRPKGGDRDSQNPIDAVGGESSVAADNSNRTQTIDPDQLSDALLSAGVDLKEEENLLSSSLHVDTLKRTAGSIATVVGEASGRHFARSFQTPFLDLGNLYGAVKSTSNEMGLKKVSERELDIGSLLSVSCEEWLSDIVATAVVFSRHRRRSRNSGHSSISKALKTIATKDKEREDRRTAQKAMLGLSQDPLLESDSVKLEETQYKAANATALMMTSGKKKYSWLSGSGPEGGMNQRNSSNQKVRNDHGIKYREAREEPGIALRDLLAALEERRVGPGIEKCLQKGYSRLKG